jgi:hypothetical protein
MVLRVLFLMLPVCLAYGWDRAKAFQFLEQRQAQWAAWKPAQNEAGSCMSCHTGVPYLLARKALGVAALTDEPLVRATVRRIEANPALAMGFDEGAESVLNVWTLALSNSSNAAKTAALSRLWQLQIQTGPEKGSWTWVMAGLEPWDSPTANYFGAALAQQALRPYQDLPSAKVDALRAYLKSHAKAQPLHNRLAWIAWGNWPTEKLDVLQELWAVQETDGGFRTEALGPWMERKNAPPDQGSNAYATAWAAYAAREAGVPCSDRSLRRALTWLERHQDASTGAWQAVSMNRRHAPESFTAGFMTDAATGFAAAALLSCKDGR